MTGIEELVKWMHKTYFTGQQPAYKPSTIRQTYDKACQLLVEEESVTRLDGIPTDELFDEIERRRRCRGCASLMYPPACNSSLVCVWQNPDRLRDGFRPKDK